MIELPPPHVLAQLDAIIVGQESIVAINGDLQTVHDHAVNAAIRRAGLEGRRKTNPVVDGQLVPKPPGAHNKKRHREEPAVADVPPPTRARRPRRAVDYAAMNDPDLGDEGGDSD